MIVLRTWVWGAVVGMATCTAGRAQADLVIDQQTTTPPNGGTSTDVISPLGQTFTPTLTAIDFAGFALSQSVTGPQAQGGAYRVSLHQGDTLNGLLLGTTPDLFLAPGFVPGFHDFYFPTRITLTPGQTYTLSFEKVFGDGVLIAGDERTEYAGGMAILRGAPFPGLNFNFREGLFIPAPEPPSLALITAAVPPGLVYWWLRRRPRLGA
ncbi:MAG TPA: hypothetical protein VGZ22_19230 [Isosphaeraceae bacterium]|jgi:hypothetical protein|nr:hypothetical protein [Isosphaeraceae bacterium]